MTHFAIVAAAALLGLVAVGCSSDDDEPAPPDSSVLAIFEDALCDAYGPAGSMVLDGEIYDMSDCPD